MKKQYKVVWAQTAENDLLKILEYIFQSSPINALKILKKVKQQVAGLYFSPERCRIVPELYEHGITQYREMIIPPWRIMYRIQDASVYVLSVLDSRQNIEDILLKRYVGHLI